MVKVVSIIGILIYGVLGQAQANSRLFRSSPYASTPRKDQQALRNAQNDENSLSFLENRLNLLETEFKSRIESMESKHAELFTCLNVEGGNKIVMKEGCHLVVKKGNHQIEGQLNILGNHVIEGGNLHIHDGTGTHDCSYGSSSTKKPRCNGSGNLIMGHSPESSKKLHRVLSGSHNIILGTNHSVLSHGGLVSGVGHNVLGEHASAIAGTKNTAAGEGSAVLGGSSNLAGSIVGGVYNSNKATGSYATVTGGYTNSASGSVSSVSGGAYGTASVSYSSVSGGYKNTASGGSSSVSGGAHNEASGGASWVSGGQKNNANADFSSVVGGKVVG